MQFCFFSISRKPASQDEQIYNEITDGVLKHEINLNKVIQSIPRVDDRAYESSYTVSPTIKKDKIALQEEEAYNECGHIPVSTSPINPNTNGITNQANVSGNDGLIKCNTITSNVTQNNAITSKVQQRNASTSSGSHVFVNQNVYNKPDEGNFSLYASPDNVVVQNQLNGLPKYYVLEESPEVSVSSGAEYSVIEKDNASGTEYSIIEKGNVSASSTGCSQDAVYESSYAVSAAIQMNKIAVQEKEAYNEYGNISVNPSSGISSSNANQTSLPEYCAPIKSMRSQKMSGVSTPSYLQQSKGKPKGNASESNISISENTEEYKNRYSFQDYDSPITNNNSIVRDLYAVVDKSKKYSEK